MRVPSPVLMEKLQDIISELDRISKSLAEVGLTKVANELYNVTDKLESFVSKIQDGRLVKQRNTESSKGSTK